MGVDLKVMASRFRELRRELLPTATLRFERDPVLFAQLSLEATPPLARPLPPGLRVGVYEDEGLVFTGADRQGQPLTFTTPADIRALRVSVCRRVEDALQDRVFKAGLAARRRFGSRLRQLWRIGDHRETRATSGPCRP
jgi:hypothetical protein